MQPPGKAQEGKFRMFMAEAGDLAVNGRPYARMRLLSVPETVGGKKTGGRLGFAFLTGRPGCCTLFRPRHPIPRRQNRAVPQPLPGSVCVTTKDNT